MDLLSLKSLVLLTSWLVGLWLAVGVWKSKDPVVLKLILTAIAVAPIIGPLVVYWISNFPSRLHPDVQAKFPKVVNTYSFWRTEDDVQAPSLSQARSKLKAKRRRQTRRPHTHTRVKSQQTGQGQSRSVPKGRRSAA